ncbi:MAG TPA: hypothetical protein VGV57_06510 [Thermoleophilaceae bacterium]|nr:hypothetical protein [Thermoleophilaceae bacterium]
MNGIAGDLVRQIVAQHDDIEIVDAVANADYLDALGTVADLDLVITTYGPHRAELRHLDRVLAARPGLSALATQDQGRTAVMYTLVPKTTQLGQLSPDTLVEFIRTLPRLDPSGSLG